MIELFQQMMCTVRVGFIAIVSDMHAVTACAWFRRDRKGNIQTAHTNVAVANVAIVAVAIVAVAIFASANFALANVAISLAADLTHWAAG